MATISERIAALRRERGMTQEQLGQLVGVSAQAVSKWEKGGAPDVELLPALADRLGVSIDALFGRDQGQTRDMPRLLTQWLWGLPEQMRMHELFYLLASATHSLAIPEQFGIALGVDSANCYMKTNGPKGEETRWMRSKVVTEEGMVLGVLAKNFPLYLLMPEPAEGYAAHFAGNEEYRTLFAALSRPGGLEILRYLCGKEYSYSTVAAVVKHTGVSRTQAEQALEALIQCHVLKKTFIEVEEGPIDAYMPNDQRSLVPFLYFARWMMEKDENWLYGYDDRERSILNPGEREETNEKES